ncbi:hypothetical protein Q7P37_002559 [Cladosporium fusiforme]
MANRLYVGNLLYQVQPEEICDMFENKKVKFDKIDISIDPFSGRNSSYCFVDLDSTEDIQHVLERLRGACIRGRPIKVNSDTGKRQRSSQRVQTQTQSGEWRTFDLDPEDSTMVFDRYSRTEDAREHWTKPIDEGRRLFVGGLSDVSDQRFVNAEMRELFQDFAIQAVSKRILPAHRNMSIPATGQCYCFVDLPSAEAAQRAISELNGRPTPYGGAYKLNTAYRQEDRKVCREQASILGIKRITGEPQRNLYSNWRSKVPK